MKSALLRISLLVALAFPMFPTFSHSAFADDAGVTEAAPSDDAAASTPAPASDGSAAPAPSSPADKLHNPAQSPAAAWDEVKAAKRTSWPLLIWTIVAMLGKALAYGRDKLKGKPVVGRLAAWLAKGKGAMILAGISAVGSAGLAVLADGGSLVAVIVASGVAIGGVTHSTTQPPKTDKTETKTEGN